MHCSLVFRAFLISPEKLQIKCLEDGGHSITSVQVVLVVGLHILTVLKALTVRDE